MSWICEKAKNCPSATGDDPCLFSKPRVHRAKADFCKVISKIEGKPTNVEDIYIEKGGS